jgi:hypothetical protein
MVQLNSCCQVVKMVSAGEDGLMGGRVIFNQLVHIYSVALFFQNHVYINKTYKTNNKSVMDNYAYIVFLVLSKTCFVYTKLQ